MAARPPHTVVVCPPSRHVSSSQRYRERNPADHRKICRPVCLIAVVAAVLITGVVLLGVFLSREFPTGDPVYSVAITGVTGLTNLSSAAGDGDTITLSPAFNLTLHIDNTRNSAYRACVPDLSAAAVSIGDTVLANGTVPPFCAEEKRESEQRVAASRVAGDIVAVPRSLLDQMAGEVAAAGEASVDVRVTMPRYEAQGTCGDAVLSCKAKIGVGAGAAGPSPPCRLDYVTTCHDDDQSKREEEYGYGGPPPMFVWPWPPFYMYPFFHE